MNKSWVIIFAFWLVAGCNPVSTPSPITTFERETVATHLVNTATTTPTPTHNATATPTPSATPSSTPPKASSPTITPTPEPQMISIDNASQLKVLATYTIPARGQLMKAHWSHDGQLVLVTTSLGLDLLDASLSKQVNSFPNLNLIQEFSDGRWLVENSQGRHILKLEDGKAQLSAVTNRLLTEPGVLFSDNGEVAVYMINEHEFEVLELASDTRRIFNFQTAGYFWNYEQVVSISPDGKRLCAQVGDWVDALALLIDLETLKVLGEYPRLYSEPVFAPDSQSFLIQDAGGFKVVNASNGIQINRFADGFYDRPAPKTWVSYQAVDNAYQPNSQGVGVVYCVQNEKCDFYIWSLMTGVSEIPLRNLHPGILSISFSSDGKKLVTSSQAGVVQIWDLATASMLAESSSFDRTKPAISSDGKLVAFSRLNKIEVYNLETGELLKELGDYSITLTLKIDAFDGQQLLVVGAQGYDETFVDLWDLSTGELLRKFKTLAYLDTYIEDPFCLHAREGQRVACGSDPLQVFDTQLGTLLLSYKKTSDYLEWTISPDGKLLASCTIIYPPDYSQPIRGDRIFLVDPTSWESQISGVLESPLGEICAPMVFSPNNQYLAAQSGYIWEIGQAQPLASFSTMEYKKLAFSPDGEILVADNLVMATRSGKILKQLEVNGVIREISFDPTGYRLVIQVDQGVSVWGVTR